MKQNTETTEEILEMIRGWATTRGLYEKGDVKTQFCKLGEEFGELGRAIIKDDKQMLEDSIGDMIVVLTNLAHLAGTSPERCLRLAWDEIKNRKGKMQNGSFVKE
jgi:NTP pyrophosphatase (non-canonical NTP hydrolase)